MDNIYYTLTILQIYYDEKSYLDLVLKCDEQKFYCYADEDDTFYEMEVIESRKRALSSYKKSIIIYDKPNFNKLLCETKYKHRVEELINECDKKWEDIIRIVKVEERFEANKLTFVNNRVQIKREAV